MPVPECLEHSWIVQNYKDDLDAIKTFLNSDVDTTQLVEMKNASSLVEAPNIEKKPNEEELKKILEKAADKKDRNQLIVKAYQEGYSQHMIAKVLHISQQAVHGIIKRSRK